MSETAERERIDVIDAVSIEAPRALKQSQSLVGVRVYDVRQGDAIAVLDEDSQPVLLIDYRGRQGNPFTIKKKQAVKRSVDTVMPVASGALVMVTQWDEDHWSSAPKGKAARGADWLVPRQVTSPRAVRFSTSLANVSCVPKTRVGQIFEFVAQNGDSVLWQKIAVSSPAPSIHQNCNRTGVALALVRRSEKGGQAILLPGDAPFHEVPLFQKLAKSDHTLTGLVAFHHGAGTHWTKATQ